jgi:dipeptidyl aminopeptidase/acylaminoacyl peptidase
VKPAADDLIPETLLLERAARDHPTISPDGSTIAFVSPIRDTLNLWVQPLGSDEPRPLTDQAEQHLERYWWTDDSASLVYLHAPPGRETWGLWAVDLAGGGSRRLTPESLGQITGTWTADACGSSGIAVSARTPGRHALYGLSAAAAEEPPRELAASRAFHQWIVDGQLMPRGGVRAEADGSATVVLSAQAGRPWRKVLTIPADDVADLAVQRFDVAGRRLFLVSSLGGATRRLLALDAATGRWEVMFEDPGYDLGAGDLPFSDGVWFDPVGSEPDLVTVLPGRMRSTPLTARAARALAILGDLDDGDPFVTSRDRTNRHWLVGFLHDDRPIPYYLVDVETGAHQFLFVHRPSLARFRLAPKRPCRFRARDGLEINGYLTRPLGRRDGPDPAVLLVHGGPSSRDIWRFDPLVQWIVNRGYACLEINFRGSTGYGRAFRLAGQGEWGGKMQDDLYDAVRWAAEAGYVDRDRVAVMGQSYGGFAALSAACAWPDGTRCAVALSAPCDLEAFVSSTPAYWRPLLALVRRQIAGDGQDLTALRERSPAHRIEDFRVPVFIAHGALDPRIPVDQVDRLVAGLRGRAVEVEYLRFRDEGHPIRGTDNVLAIYRRLERFLARHLGGRCSPPPSHR